MKLIYSSEIQITPTDKGFIVIKQTAPQVGQVVIHVSEMRGFLSLLTMAADDAAEPPPAFGDPRKS